MKMRTDNTAQAAYLSAEAAAVRLLATIEEQIGHHHTPDPSTHWGHVGDMRHVVAMLGDVVTHLDGSE